MAESYGQWKKETLYENERKKWQVTDEQSERPLLQTEILY